MLAILNNFFTHSQHRHAHGSGTSTNQSWAMSLCHISDHQNYEFHTNHGRFRRILIFPLLSCLSEASWSWYWTSITSGLIIINLSTPKTNIRYFGQYVIRSFFHTDSHIELAGLGINWHHTWHRQPSDLENWGVNINSDIYSTFLTLLTRPYLADNDRTLT